MLALLDRHGALATRGAALMAAVTSNTCRRLRKSISLSLEDMEKWKNRSLHPDGHEREDGVHPACTDGRRDATPAPIFGWVLHPSSHQNPPSSSPHALSHPCSRMLRAPRRAPSKPDPRHPPKNEGTHPWRRDGTERVQRKRASSSRPLRRPQTEEIAPAIFNMIT